MSTNGGYTDDEGNQMSRRTGDDEFDRILQGGSPHDPSFGALEEIVEALRSPDAIDPSVSAAHIAGAAALARTVPTPVAAAAERLPWWRRQLVRLAGLGLTAKILLGAAVAVAATGGAAATGILPDPIQSAIADTVSHVGIELPHPGPETTTTTTEAEPDDDDAVVTASSTSSTTTPTTAPDGDDDEPATPAVAGDGIWESTSCSGAPISVGYTITADGRLTLGAIVGSVKDVDADDDRIRVRYTDDVRVEIRLHDDAITVDEDRECAIGSTSTTTTTTVGDHDGDEGTTTTTTEPDDDNSGPGGGDDGTTTTTEADDHHGSDDHHDDGTTTTTAPDDDHSDDD